MCCRRCGLEHSQDGNFVFETLTLVTLATKVNAGDINKHPVSIKMITTIFLVLFSVYVHSAISQWRTCIHSVRLKDSILSIV